MAKLTKPKHKFVVAQPHILVGEGDINPTIRLHILKRIDAHRHGTSGEYVHLEIPNAEAMKLLVLLRNYQNAMGLPDPPNPPISATDRPKSTH